MAINEMFLDTAVLRDSVVSRAKDLNYLPRSARSSVGYVDIQITAIDNPPYIAIPSGTKFQGTDGAAIYTFATVSNTIITPISNTYISTNVAIQEGVSLSETFIVNTAIQDQRFIISNPNIDTTTLAVTVTNDLGSAETWDYYPTLFDVKTTTKAYFLQATSDKYEIVFGNGITGAAPINGARVVARYIAGNLDKPNGITSYRAAGTFAGYSGVVTPTYYANGAPKAAAGGLAPETTKSIRFNAPRAYQTLERAVTAEDYRNILFRQFPDIRDIRVYGGDEISPPNYGTVYVAVDLTNAVGISDLQKDKIQSFVSTRAPISITPVVVAADYTMLGITSTIKYDLNKSGSAPSDIRGSVLAAIQTYDNDNLGVFNTRFRYSQLLAAIDNADASIVDNETSTIIIKEFNPVLNENYSAALTYQNSLIPSSVFSTAFTYTGLQCTLSDDGEGNLFIVSTNDGIETNIELIGTVDYVAGIINIINLNVSEYIGNYIAVYGTPTTNDVSSRQNTIMQIDFENVLIDVTGIRV
jgi:hypothetical protein